jgi:hypothetical protein
MKYAVDMGSGAVIYIPSFIKTGSGIQTLIGGDTQTHRQHGDRISLLLVFQNKESGIKIKACLCDYHAVCVSVHAPINVRMPEPIFTKLGMYIMAPEPISTAYFINVYPLSLIGNGSVKTLPQQLIHTQQQKNCWTRRFLCGPYRIKGKEAISSSQNFLFNYAV